MGGWLKVSGDPIYVQSKAVIRNILAWRDNTNTRFHVMGSADALLMQAGEYSNESLQDIAPNDYSKGRESGTVSKGYGAGPYGRGPYGSDWTGSDEGDGATTEILNATVWHLGVRLGRLYATSTSDQRVLEWTPPDGTIKAEPVQNAPEGVLCMCITQNMQIMVVGDGQNRNIIRWCDSADITQWTPALDGTNNADFIEYPLIGQPMRLMPYGQDILLFTTTALYRLSYHGAAAGYGVVKIPGESSAPIGPNAIIETGVGLAWMGRGEIYQFNGAVVTAMSCDVHDWVFEKLNRVQGWKVASAIIPTQSEVYWFFPTTDSSEPDRYVAFDYEQGAWLKGTGLQRSAWVNPGIYEQPLACGVDNTLYIQESGAQAGGRNMESRALMMVPPIPGREMVIDELHHDLVGDGNTYPAATMRLWVANAPGEKLAIRHESPLDADGITKCLCNGKWIAVEYEITAWGKWRLGDANLYARPGGKRGRRAAQGMRGDPASPPTFGTPQLISEFFLLNVDSTTALVAFDVDRSCTWSTFIAGRTYSGQVIYEPVGRPKPLRQRKVTVSVRFVELIPETDYEPVFTLTNISGGGTSQYQMPVFTTDTATGAPLIRNMHWEDVTSDSATLYFTTNVDGKQFDVYMTQFTGGGTRPPEYNYPGISTDTGESVIYVGSTNPTFPTPGLDPGCEWRPEDGLLLLRGPFGENPQAIEPCPTLLTAGPITPPTVSNLQWSAVGSDTATLSGSIAGYAYPGTVRIRVQAPAGRTTRVIEEQEIWADGFSITLTGMASASEYNGTVTVDNRAGTTSTPVPTVITAQ